MEPGLSSRALARPGDPPGPRIDIARL